MLSNVYGGVIKFCENNEDCFITDNNSKLHQKSIKPLNEGHPSAGKYVKATQRLFSQIKISECNLWIMPTIGTQSVRIYFSDPIIYPVGTCCQKCVYIDMEKNLNGSIICPACNMILVSFIHYDESCNEFGDLDQVDKFALFREKKRQDHMKNRLMHENLTSNKFKTKNLKKALLNHSKLSEKSFKLNNTADQLNLKKGIQFKQKQSTGVSKDGFILQIKASSLKKNKHRSYQNQNKFYGLKNTNNQKITISKKYQQETKRELDHQLSIEETRKIVQDIFR